MQTVYQLFCDSVARYADHPFLHIPINACKSYASEPVEVSYAQAARQVEQLRAHYSQAGFGSGHTVALVLQNRLEFLVHWLALNSLGSCVVPVNDEMSAEEQAYIINHSEACLLVYLPEFKPRVESLQPLLIAQPGCLPTDQLEQMPAAVTAAIDQAPELASKCAILYTSGSTGKPKGCVLGNDYFLLSGRRYVDTGGLCAIEPGCDRLITPLPLVHMNAMACSTLAMIMTGGCIIQLDRFHPSTWWQSVRDSRATIAHYLGVMPAMLLGREPEPEDVYGQLRFAFGAGVNPKHHASFEARFGFPLIEAWGMTETGNHCAIVASEEPRHVGSSCFGVPSEHLELKLVDETGARVATGEPGELLLRHRGENPRRGFFDEYLKNPQATAEAWAEGWFHTGDVVRQDDQGSLYFVDRRKNVIRRSGENISALEVEAALSENPAIAMAVVCPVPDDIRGDEVMACVIPAAGENPSLEAAEDIATSALQSLVYFKIPGYIHFCTQLPLTPSAKPRRAEIKTLAAKSLTEGECYDVRHLKKRKASTA